MSHHPEVQPCQLDAVINDIEIAIEAWDRPKRQSECEARYEVRSLKSTLQNLSVEVQFEIYQLSIRFCDKFVLQVGLFIYMIFYCVFFIFQFKEMDDGITRRIATLTFRFEHDQASGVSSRCLFREIQNLKNEQREIQKHRRELLDFLTDFFLE